MVLDVLQSLRRPDVDSERKLRLAKKFADWLEKSKCKVDVASAGNLTILQITQLGANGNPYNTVFYTSFFGVYATHEERLAEALEVRCTGQPLIDRLDMIGLGAASTLEELELKLEIVDAG